MSHMTNLGAEADALLELAHDPAIPWLIRPVEDAKGDPIYRPGLISAGLGDLGVRLNKQYEPYVYSRIDAILPRETASRLIFSPDITTTLSRMAIVSYPDLPFSFEDPARIRTIYELTSRYMVENRQRTAMIEVSRTADRLSDRYRQLKGGALDPTYNEPKLMEGAAIVEELIRTTKQSSIPERLGATAQRLVDLGVEWVEDIASREFLSPEYTLRLLAQEV